MLKTWLRRFEISHNILSLAQAYKLNTRSTYVAKQTPRVINLYHSQEKASLNLKTSLVISISKIFLSGVKSHIYKL